MPSFLHPHPLNAIKCTTPRQLLPVKRTFKPRGSSHGCGLYGHQSAGKSPGIPPWPTRHRLRGHYHRIKYTTRDSWTQTVVEQLSGMVSERFGPVEGGGHLQVSPEIMAIAGRQLPHLLARAGRAFVSDDRSCESPH